MKITKEIEIKDLALYIKKEKALVISDLQLGYEENLLEQGILIPFQQFDEIKTRLKKILKNLKLQKIIINGDLKHEFGKISRQEWNEVLSLIDFLLKYCKEIIIIKGNHDIVLNSATKKKGIHIQDHYTLNNIFITHGHKLQEIPKNITTIIIGHDHPAISLKDGDITETYKCYLKGKYKNKTLIVQPSLFLLNEGTDILKYKPSSPFLNQNLNNFEVYVIADKTFYFGKIKDIKSHN
jgi:hypothetical protein